MIRLRSALALLLLPALIGLVGCESTVNAPAEVPLSAETKRATEVLPSGATFVSMINATKMAEGRSTPISEQMDGEHGARLRGFLEAAGFDPARDLQEVYVAGSENGGASIAAYVEMDRARVQQAFEEQLQSDWTRSTYGGLPVYKHQEEEHSLMFALANDNLILAASRPAALHAMIDRLGDAGPAALADDAALMPLVRKVQGHGDAWFVLRGVNDVMTQASVRNDEDNPDLHRLRRAVRDAAASFTLDEARVEGTAYLTAAPDVDPADLANVVEGAVAALRTSPEVDGPQRQALDDVRVQQRGSEVTVAFALPRSLLDRKR